MAKLDYLDAVRVAPGTRVRLKDFDPRFEPKALEQLDKDAAKKKARAILADDREALAEAQDLLYATETCAVLVVLQALDAAGKDGTIKHVMSGLNPQGCEVHGFKQPSREELDHDFLWRFARALPRRGRIGIFNRSYYEDVLVVRVHPELLDSQRLPAGKRGKSFWRARFEDINAFEQHLVRNGTVVLKFFLNISKEEQRRRFLDRLERPEKRWKFSPADLVERGYWEDYIEAYEEALSATSTEEAPWYILPSDHKWIARSMVADILADSIRSLGLSYPEFTPEQLKELDEARRQLETE